MKRRRLLGVHWQPYHRDGSDAGWFRYLDPWFVKVVWSGQPPFVEDLPDGATYLFRDYGFEAEHRHLLATSPEVLGLLHAKASISASLHLSERGVPKNRQLFESINEPAVWSGETYAKVAIYCAAFLHHLHANGLFGVVGNLGVGWPGNRGGETPPNWDWFDPVARMMAPNGGDYLGVHEYWADNGARENWGWWGGRVLKCPFNVQILVTECGVDSGVKYPGSHEGWLTMYGTSTEESAARYVNELWDYMGLMATDRRVKGVAPYTYDFATGSGGHPWWDMDQRNDVLKEAMRRKISAEGVPSVEGPVIVEPPPDPSVFVDLVGKLPTAPGRSYPTREKKEADLSVLHYSWVSPPPPNQAAEVEQIRSIARGHIRAGWPAIGYHYIVGPSGTIYQVNPLTDVAFHAGRFNRRSVGVCCLMRERPPTRQQVLATAALLNELGLEVRPHSGLMSTRCPGPVLFPLVKEAMGEPPGPGGPTDPPAWNITTSHLPTVGQGLPIVLGDYPFENVTATLSWEHGQLGSTVTGSKKEHGNGGFELYAGDGKSTHLITVEGVTYTVPMVLGKSAFCRWTRA